MEHAIATILKKGNLITKSIICCTALLLCLLSGCSMLPVTQQPTKHGSINKQEYIQKAKLLLNKASSLENYTNNPVAVDYQLQATEHLILSEELEHANNLIAVITPLNTEQEYWQQILRAQLANAKQTPNSAAAWLKNIWSPYTLPAALQIKFLQTRSTTNLRLGDRIAAVNDFIRLDTLLTNHDDKKDNAQNIWNTLGQLTPATLTDLNNKHNDEILSGWINFVHITKQYDSSPEQMSRAIAVWRQNYPQHPANMIVPNDYTAIANEDANTSTPNKIGLLLPLSGNYAQSAEIIKNGFLSAYYQHLQMSGSKSEIKIYDTSKQAGVYQAYNNALEDKVDFLVGPLIKEDVEKLTNRSSIKTPILALNTLANTNKSSSQNFYQFGLAPEIEASNVAERAQQDGFHRAILFVPNNAQGQRITNAFRTSWEGMGLDLVAVMPVSEKINLNEEIRKILHANVIERKPNQKDNNSSNTKSASSQPHRRQDIDVIIIATNPNLARQIKPLLNYYYANDIPVYATSSIYSGKPNHSLDQDLNGINFCDMPWVLDSTISSRRIYQSIAKLWPNDLTQTPRLFALGIDAYKLTIQIQQLNLMPNVGISGMTGMLILDEKNRIKRNLIWATFKNGVPVLSNNN